MARPKSSNPTDYELSILKILWEESPLSVSQILERIEKKAKPAYSSLLTIVRLMETKGYLNHEKRGKAFFYWPILKQEKVSHQAITKLVDSIFGGNPYKLAVNIIQKEQLSEDEVAELKRIVEEL